jgi:hypothetical protein
MTSPAFFEGERGDPRRDFRVGLSQSIHLDGENSVASDSRCTMCILGLRSADRNRSREASGLGSAQNLRGQPSQEPRRRNCHGIAPPWLDPSRGKGDDSAPASGCVTTDFDCATIPVVRPPISRQVPSRASASSRTPKPRVPADSSSCPASQSHIAHRSLDMCRQGSPFCPRRHQTRNGCLNGLGI